MSSTWRLGGSDKACPSPQLGTALVLKTGGCEVKMFCSAVALSTSNEPLGNSEHCDLAFLSSCLDAVFSSALKQLGAMRAVPYCFGSFVFWQL